MVDNNHRSDLLEDVRLMLNEVAMRERLPSELSDRDLKLIAVMGTPAVEEVQDQLNALADQVQLLTPSPANLERIDKERARIQRQALRVIEYYTALFACLAEQRARQIAKP